MSPWSGSVLCDSSSPFAAWKFWVKLAPEYCYSGSPLKPAWGSGVDEYWLPPAKITGEQTRSYWNEGGAWWEFPVNAPPSPVDRGQSIMFPTGQLGYRSAHQLVPIEGRRASSGSFDFDFMPDIGGLLLWWAMGATSATTLTADATPTLYGPAIWANGVALVGLANPTNPSVLLIRLADATAAAASSTIRIVGTDINGNAVTETLNIQQSTLDVSGDYYTRYVYATLTSITITGLTVGGAALCTVFAYNSITHTFSMYDTQPTFKMEEYGLPHSTTGSSFFHRGMICTSLSLAFDAAAPEGIMAESADFVGIYPVTGSPTCTRPRLPLLAPMAAWTCAISTGGAAYRKARGGEIAFDTGAHSHEVAIGTQDPFGPVWGPRDLTLTLRVNAEDATELGWIENQTVNNLSIVFTSPYRISGTTYFSLTLDMTRAYIESLSDSESEDLMETELVLRPITDETLNAAGLPREIMTATLVNQVISYAGYDGS